MRKKPLILLAFLLMLYISPMIFVGSYGPTTIPTTEQNMNKDFLLSSGSGPWLIGWDYRKSLTITGSAGASTDYPVSIDVTFDSDMQADFDDIRFTDNDAETELAYWREVYTISTSATFWVEVTDNLDTNQNIYMYYGNSTVSTTSNGENVFIFFDDFESEDLSAWDTTEANWEAQPEPTPEFRGWVAFGDADDAGRILSKDFTDELEDDTDFMIHSWMRNQVQTSTSFPMYAFDDAVDEVYFLGTGDDDFRTYDGTAWRIYDEASAIDDTWIRTEVAVDNTNSLFRLWIDRAPAENTWPNTNGQGNTIGDIEELGAITSTTEGSDQWLDDYYIRKWILVEPEFDSFGEEEEYIAPQWNIHNSVEIGFFMLLYMVPFDMFFIILGLVLIPVSTLFLVKGARSEMSTDKLFVVLILFFMGWGLFLGGIFG